jgi:hypothetical protein
LQNTSSEQFSSSITESSSEMGCETAGGGLLVDEEMAVIVDIFLVESSPARF